MGRLSTPVVLVALLVVAVLPVLGGGCKRPCESAENCKRSCSCLNKETDTRADCTMAFRCEGADQFCEPAYNDMSCDDLCGQYAARAQCGRQRCAVDEECRKVISCAVLAADGTPVSPAQQFACTLDFICDQDAELCDAAATLGDAQLCLSVVCRSQQGVAGG